MANLNSFECISSSSSKYRALSSLSSSTSSSLVEGRRCHSLHSYLKLLQNKEWKRRTTVRNAQHGDRSRSALDGSIRHRPPRRHRSSSIVTGDKESIPTTFFVPSRDSLLWDEVVEERRGQDLLFCDHEDFSHENNALFHEEDEGEDLGSSWDQETPLPSSPRSRVEELEGIPVKEWLLKFVESISPRARGIILLNMLTFLYGSNIAIIKESEEILDPASFSVGRFAIAALVFAPFLKDACKNQNVAKAGMELGAWASFAYLAQALGLMTTDAGRASFFTTFTVIVVPLIAGMLGKKIPILTWIAAVTALFGVGLLETSGSPPSVGDAWNLSSAVVFGIHMLRTELHSRSFSRHEALPIIAVQLSVITASSFAWSLASHLSAGDVLPNLSSLDWPAMYQSLLKMPWFAMLYTGLFSTAFCLSAELLAMRDVSATEAAVISTLEPLWGAAFAWFLLGERWGLRGWVGAAFILGGSTVTQIWGSPEVPVNPLNKTPIPRNEMLDLELKVLIKAKADKLTERR